MAIIKHNINPIQVNGMTPNIGAKMANPIRNIARINKS
jgi:hypothetical protein